MISYAGVYLADPTPTLAAWVEKNVRPGELYEFAARTWPGPDRLYWPHAYHRHPAVRVGTLFWPSGASRWAVGHFVATQAQVAAIRTAVTDPTTGNVRAAQFVMEDERGGKIETGLWLLPARPLQEDAGGLGLYLLTLVDERYFWHQLADRYDVTEGTTTWADLHAAAGTRWQSPWQTTVGADPVDAAYLTPSADLAARRTPLPALLDAIALNVGQRIVRRLDGRVLSQAYDSAKAALEANLAAGYLARAGGTFAASDLTSALPEGVEVVFRKAVAGTIDEDGYYAHAVKLDTLGLSEGGPKLTGLAQTHRVFYDRAVADYASAGAADPSNAAELEALVARLAADYYRWRLRAADRSFQGVAPWTPEGFHDLAWHHGDGEATTRVRPGPWDDGRDRLLHFTIPVSEPKGILVVRARITDPKENSSTSPPFNPEIEFTYDAGEQTLTSVDSLRLDALFTDGVQLAVGDRLLYGYQYVTGTDYGVYEVEQLGRNAEVRVTAVTDGDYKTKNEVQQIEIASADGGTFTLTYQGTQTTAAIPYNASAADVETALEALADITDVTVTGANPFTVTFNDDTGDRQLLRANTANLTDSAAAQIVLRRTADASKGGDFDGMLVLVREGQAWASTLWVQRAAGPVTLDTTELEFARLHKDNQFTYVDAVTSWVPEYTRTGNQLVANENGALPSIGGMRGDLTNRFILFNPGGSFPAMKGGGYTYLDAGIYFVADPGSAATPWVLEKWQNQAMPTSGTETFFSFPGAEPFPHLVVCLPNSSSQQTDNWASVWSRVGNIGSYQPIRYRRLYPHWRALAAADALPEYEFLGGTGSTLARATTVGALPAQDGVTLKEVGEGGTAEGDLLLDATNGYLFRVCRKGDASTKFLLSVEALANEAPLVQVKQGGQYGLWAADFRAAAMTSASFFRVSAGDAVELKVGTTPIDGGTDGKVLVIAGGNLAESSGLRHSGGVTAFSGGAPLDASLNNGEVSAPYLKSV